MGSAHQVPPGLSPDIGRTLPQGGAAAVKQGERPGLDVRGVLPWCAS